MRFNFKIFFLASFFVLSFFKSEIKIINYYNFFVNFFSKKNENYKFKNNFLKNHYIFDTYNAEELTGISKSPLGKFIYKFFNLNIFKKKPIKNLLKINEVKVSEIKNKSKKPF